MSAIGTSSGTTRVPADALAPRTRNCPAARAAGGRSPAAPSSGAGDLPRGVAGSPQPVGGEERAVDVVRERAQVV
ncbi:MAG: hypothetical protein J0H67_09965, partial [Rhodospirillales bacterium]|nr:hypothetical protein [Rhodospirillales bacterium]